MRDNYTWSEAHEEEAEGCVSALLGLWTLSAIILAFKFPAWRHVGEAAVGVLVLVLIGRRRARIREVQHKRRREELERYVAEKAVREAARLERAARRRGGR